MNSLQPLGRNDGHVFDYSKITDRIYIGSDLCKGGVCLIHGEEFKKLGVCVELNLSAENNELPPKDIESYMWLPVVDGRAPSAMQLELGTSLINTVVEQGRTVYIHCKNGHGRSPTLVAAYLIRYKGYSVLSAMGIVAERREESHIEDVQVKALEKFAKRWSR